MGERRLAILRLRVSGAAAVNLLAAVTLCLASALAGCAQLGVGNLSASSSDSPVGDSPAVSEPAPTAAAPASAGPTPAERSDEPEQRIAQLEYELAVAAKERETAESTVSQLREELARAERHLVWYAEQHDKLDAKRQKLQQQAQRLRHELAEARRAALLLRDLALAMRRYVKWKLVELRIEDGVPVVQLDARRAFPGSATPSWRARRALKALARVVEPSSRSILIQVPRSTAPSPVAMQAVADFLIEQGLPPERVKLAESSGPRGGSAATPQVAEASVNAAEPTAAPGTQKSSQHVALILVEDKSEGAASELRTSGTSPPKVASDVSARSGDRAVLPDAKRKRRTPN